MVRGLWGADLKIAIKYQFPFFHDTLFFRLLSKLTPNGIEITSPVNADIIIYGPFGRDLKAFGPFVKRKNKKGLVKLPKRTYQPLHVFHTIESERPSDIYDYSITFDYMQNQSNHFRLPYWLESIDWEHEGLGRGQHPRISRRITIEELMSPLGDEFTRRNGKCAAFFGHLREPRATFMEVLANRIEIDGYGRAFDLSVKSAEKSGIDKDAVLKEYSYCLCPENSIYPGYYTEKILEAFAAGCLPISWADSNVADDFNPDSFINLLPFASVGYEKSLNQLNDPKAMEKFAGAPLLLERPSLDPLKKFIRAIIADAR